MKPEVKFGENTNRFSHNQKKQKAFIEVKNVTLSRRKGLQEFPDAKLLEA